jgi:hypothetical protein
MMIFSRESVKVGGVKRLEHCVLESMTATVTV